MVYLLTFISLLFSQLCYGQIASNSLFREMKSVNPAVISHRPAAILAITGSVDKIKKTQDISSMYGDGATNTSNIKVQGGKLFYGGKGPGFTNEIFFESASGTKKDELVSSSESMSASNSVSSMYALWGLGLGPNFGVNIGLLKYQYADKFSGTFGGSSFENNNELDALARIVKLGWKARILADIGLFYEHFDATTDMVNDGVSTSGKDKFRTFGVGIGAAAKQFHFEIGYEKRLGTKEFNGKKTSPDRITGTLEFRTGKLSLGYTGRYYRDGFFDLEGLLYNNLAYQGAQDKARLEHGFNFSYGSDKGHSLSGSAYYSKTQTKEDITTIMTGLKFDTTIEALGLSAKYSYAF